MPDRQLIFDGELFLPGASSRAKPATHYLWDIDADPPELGQHSLTKHEVLKAYLEKYVAILAARPEQEQLKLTLVDGFAGGGAYLHPETRQRLPGSPLIMVDAMTAAETAANDLRRKEFHLDVEYLFIEKLERTRAFLQNELNQSDAAKRHKERIQLLAGSFSEHLNAILDRVEQRGRSRRVIFVLDQYGFTDVRMADLRTIFGRLKNAEVILTIAIDWLIDHWTEKANYAQILHHLGINLSADFATIVKKSSPSDWRRIIQNTLHAEFRQNSGADYYTPFFIHSVDSHRAYWLLHFSGHSKARDVMMQLHWDLQNHFQHFGQAGFGMLGFDPRRELEGPPQKFISYDFDDSARSLTRDALMDEIPRRINRDGVRFAEFFNIVVNESPATKQMLASHISDLTLEKELEVWSPAGKLRQNGVQIDDDDIVKRPEQKLFLPGS